MRPARGASPAYCRHAVAKITQTVKAAALRKLSRVHGRGQCLVIKWPHSMMCVYCTILIGSLVTGHSRKWEPSQNSSLDFSDF
jgi:hypothetical protein